MNQNKGIGAYQKRPGYFMGGMIGGAILGALVNKIQGKDWKRGALFGGITGGLGSGFLGSKMGEAAIAGMKPGFMQTMLQGVNPALAGTIGGVGAAYMAGDPAYEKRKMEEAMFAEDEERKRKNEGMYPDWYKNFFPGFFKNKGGMIDERPGYYNGGGAFSDVPMEESGPTQDPIPLQIPMGQEGSFESEMEDLSGMDLAGLTDEEKGELQSLMMLRLMIPKDDPKYQQNEIRIQELLGRMSAADGGLMSRPGYMDGGMENSSGMTLASGGKEPWQIRAEIDDLNDVLSETSDPGQRQIIEIKINTLLSELGYDRAADGGLMRLHAKDGLWANIHAKRKRIAGGSGEKMRSPGSKGAPTNKALRESQATGGIMGYYGGGMSDMDLTNGGVSFGPGTGTSDEIPAMLSDGEFVVTANAVKNLGGGNRMVGAKKMYQMMNQLDPNSQTPAEMDTTGIA